MLAERLPLAFPSGHHDAGTGPMGSVLRKLIALKRLDLPTLFSPTITFIEGEIYTGLLERTEIIESYLIDLQFLLLQTMFVK